MLHGGGGRGNTVLSRRARCLRSLKACNLQIDKGLCETRAEREYWGEHPPLLSVIHVHSE